MPHPHLAYPIVGILALAATLPMLAPSLFLDSAPAATATARPRGSIVVSSFGGAAATPVAAAGERAAPPGDDRWWRGQGGRALTTTSFMSAPKSPPAPPASAPPAPPPERVEPSERAIQLVRTAPPEVRLTARVPAQIRRWEPLILKAARKHDVDPALVAAVMMTESSGNPEAISPMGAIGLMQVLGGPADPEANIDLGVTMLSSHLRRFGSIDLALAAYNAGPGNVLEHGGVPPFQETRDHIARTLASYTAWRAV